VLVKRGTLGCRCKWLKDLVDGGGEERLNEWTISVKEHLKFIEIDFIDTLSTEEGEN
jgi:hypothetical protein